MKTWYTLLSITLVLGMTLAASAVVAQMRPDSEHFESRIQTSPSVVGPAISHHRPRAGSYEAQAQLAAGGREVGGDLNPHNQLPREMASQAASGGERRIDADDLIGKRVVNASDDQLGTIKHIVRYSKTGRLSAVVSVGGFMGIGAEEVAIPLSDLRLRNGALQVPSFVDTEDELESRLSYDPLGYAPIKGDRPIARTEFAAFEQKGAEHGSAGSEDGRK